MHVADAIHRLLSHERLDETPAPVETVCELLELAIPASSHKGLELFDLPKIGPRLLDCGASGAQVTDRGGRDGPNHQDPAVARIGEGGDRDVSPATPGRSGARSRGLRSHSMNEPAPDAGRSGRPGAV
jgi:hypothetical protein